jgi:antitoxin CptB
LAGTSGYPALELCDLASSEDRIKRLKFLASKRGFLEVELVLRPFSKRYLAQADDAWLDRFEALLAQEDLDIWEMICGRRPAPQEVGESLIKQIQEFLPAGFKAQKDKGG